MFDYDNWDDQGDFVHYGFYHWPSWSKWLVPGTELEDDE
jgi:hypothetical protein